MRYINCDNCTKKIYEGKLVIGNFLNTYCSEVCLFEDLGIQEFFLSTEDCDEDDAEGDAE